jgi:hypothetical protein
MQNRNQCKGRLGNFGKHPPSVPITQERAEDVLGLWAAKFLIQLLA